MASRLWKPGGSALKPSRGVTVDASGILTRVPGVLDDAAHGYGVNDYWCNPLTGALYKCTSSTNGAAAWSSLGINTTPVLDTVGSAAAAYGLIKLRTAYAGNSFQGRRASDSTTLNVGFSGLDADFASADSFASGTSMTVAKLFDQSTNARDTADASTDAPSLGVRTVGRKRALSFPTQQSKLFTLPAGLSLDRNSFTVVMAMRPRSVSTAVFYTLGSTQFLAGFENTGSMNYFNGAQNPGLTAGHTDDAVYALTDDGTNVNGWVNDIFGTQAYPGSAGAMAGGYIPRSTGTLSAEMDVAIFWPSALSSANIAAVKEALYSQLRITPQIRDRIVIIGDSIGHGTGAGILPSWTQAMVERVSRRYVLANLSQSGQTAGTQAGQTSVYTGQYKAGARNICLIHSGTNDIGANVSGATTIGSTNTIATAMKGAGFLVGVCTMLPRSGSLSGGRDAAGFETERLAYNASMRTNYTSYADFLVDFGADPTMGVTAALSDTNLFADSVHPAPNGHLIMGNIASIALARLG